MRLIDRAVTVLRGVCDEVIVVSSRSDAPEGSWTRVPDLRSSCGPLGGIEAALDAAKGRGCEAVFVLACDLPLVDAVVVETLVGAVAGGPAVAPRRDGRPDVEPLCAVYRSSCLPAASALLDDGVRAAAALFDAVEGQRVEIAREVFLNVNTEQDLERASSLLASSDEGV